VGGGGVFFDQLTCCVKMPYMPITEARAAGHHWQARLHARCDLRLNVIPYHMFSQQQTAVRQKMPVGIRSRPKLSPTLNMPVSMQIEYYESLTIKRPQDT
jgi:hypothetical protein